MTPTEHKLLAYLRTYVAEHEFSPSYEECAEHMSLASKSGVLRLARSLERQGRITMEPTRKRSMRPVAPQGAELVESLVKALTDEEGVLEDDEHDEVLIVCTPDQARAVFLRVLAS